MYILFQKVLFRKGLRNVSDALQNMSQNFRKNFMGIWKNE